MRTNGRKSVAKVKKKLILPKADQVQQVVQEQLRRHWEPAFGSLKSFWKRDGWQKLTITVALGICAVIAATIAEDRGRQLLTLKSDFSAQRVVNEELSREHSRYQAEIEESRLRLMEAEKRFNEEKLRMRSEIDQYHAQVQAQQAAHSKTAKTANKLVDRSKKKQKKKMIAKLGKSRMKSVKNPKSTRIVSYSKKSQNRNLRSAKKVAEDNPFEI